MNDPVNHPSHYTSGAVECIDAIEAAMTFEEFVGFLRGQMIKYVWRAGRKNDAREDIEKALWYGNRLTALLKDAEPPEGKARAYFRTWLDLSDMADRARQNEAETPRAGEHLSLGELVAQRMKEDEARDKAAIEAKEAELRKLSRLEDTDGNVVLMYTDHVNWGEAPEWANFLAIDSMPAPGAYGAGSEHPRAYWFEYRPEWRGFDRYWASGGQGGRIQYAPPYSGQGGDPRLFVRAPG